MKKIHKKAAALLFAVTVAGVPFGDGIFGFYSGSKCVCTGHGNGIC